MAPRKSDGDMVLGGRHLVGIFLLLVVVFAVVFTLGYLLGRSQYDSQIRAAAAPPQRAAKTSSAEAAPPQPADWDFYHSAEPAQKPARLLPRPEKKPSSAKRSPAKSAARRAPVKLPRADRSLAAPLIPRGASVLQVAALTHRADALVLAQALQKKKFPAFILTPSTDNFYRVQVGPYASPQSVKVARQRLEKQGFKTIVRR